MSACYQTLGIDWQYDLPPQSVRQSFHCREESCAAFYRDDAERFLSIGASCIITAWKSPAHEEVAGFVTLSPNGLQGQRLGDAIQRRLGSRYSLGGKSLPCWFIGQLARAEDPALLGMGKRLVWIAIMDIVRRSHHGAGVCIVIEAEHRALVDFYMREFNFKPLYPTLEGWKPGQGRIKLFLPVRQVAETLYQVGLLSSV